MLSTHPIEAETWIILPAAGEGQRFSNRRDKLLVHLGGLPILVRSVENVLNARHVSGAVIVVHPEQKILYQRIFQEYRHQKPVLFTEGGASRQESVRNGLRAIPDSARIVGIHDAARPLINPALVDTAIEGVLHGAAGTVVALPIRDTVKQTTPEHPQQVHRTLDRSTLWRAQTPQFFRRDLLTKAYEIVPPHIPVTDDAQLVELAGLGTIELVPGEERNLKITVPDDLLLAEALLKAHPIQLLHY